MYTLVIDVGCSYTKAYVFAESCGRIEPIWRGKCETGETADAVLNSISALISGFMDCEKTIVISYGDAVWYENRQGTYVKMPVEQASFVKSLPAYEVSGKPRQKALKGIGNQLLTLAAERDISQIRRILPCSAMVASLFADNPNWKTWDWVHASNSGLYSIRDGCWLPEMRPFIEAGLIDEQVVSPATVIPSCRNEVLLGGMDTVFAVGNDIPYSTSPYLSCGTWVTASVESDISTLKPGSSTRFVLAPNGTTLKQLCFKSFKSDDRTADRINKFFENRISKVGVQVFGTWSSMLSPELEFHYEYVERPNRSYLHYQAAKYAMGIRHDIDMPDVSPHVVKEPLESSPVLASV